MLEEISCKILAPSVPFSRAADWIMEVEQVRTSEIEQYLGAAFFLPEGARRQFGSASSTARRVLGPSLMTSPSNVTSRARGRSRASGS